MGNLTVFNNAIAASYNIMGQGKIHSTRMELGYNTFVLYERAPGNFDEATIAATVGLPPGVTTFDTSHVAHDNLFLYAKPATILTTIVSGGASSLTYDSFGMTCSGVACSALVPNGVPLPIGTNSHDVAFAMTTGVDDVICMLSTRPSLNVHIRPTAASFRPVLTPTSFGSAAPGVTEPLGHDIDNDTRDKNGYRGADTVSSFGGGGCAILRPALPAPPSFVDH